MTTLGVTKAIKRMFILALREGLSASPMASSDPVIRKLQVSAEYPLKEVQYPSLWVTSNLSDIEWMSLNSVLYTPEGYPHNTASLTATINVETITLSAEERDASVDALVNMIMFGQSTDSPYYRYLIEEEYLHLTPVDGSLRLSSEGVTFGTPWDERQIAYTRTVSFSSYIEFDMRLDTGELLPLREINIEYID